MAPVDTVCSTEAIGVVHASEKRVYSARIGSKMRSERHADSRAVNGGGTTGRRSGDSAPCLMREGPELIGVARLVAEAVRARMVREPLEGGAGIERRIMVRSILW